MNRWETLHVYVDCDSTIKLSNDMSLGSYALPVRKSLVQAYLRFNIVYLKPGYSLS